MATRTLTKKTNDRYRNLVVNIRKQVAYENQCLPENVSVRMLCQYLIDKHQFLTASTWRHYRSAVRHVYGRGMDSEVINILDQIPGGGKKPELEPYGASQKMKSFPDKMLSETLTYLSLNKTKIGNALWLWLNVGIETGLRPYEWTGAERITIEGVNYLRIKNAKNTNGRANGDYRHLDLTKMSPADVSLIDAQLGVIASMRTESKGDEELFVKKFNSHYSSCRRRLNVVVRRLWPNRDKYPSLYSLRHQFIANAKKDGFTLEEIAALCGQASSQTSAIHYGRKQNGNSGRVMVRPRKEEVMTVKKGNEFFIRNQVEHK